MINEELKINYGVIETNPMPEGYHSENITDITWEELKGMKNIQAERIRFVTDPGFPYFDCSYFHVSINNNRYYVLGHPFEQVEKKNFKKNLYETLKNEGVYINKFFDSISTLN